MTHLEVSEENDKYKLIDQLGNMVPVFKFVIAEHGEKALLTVVLVEDYWSPYRSIPEERRTEFVCKDLFQNKAPKFLKTKEYNDAVAKYRELQYDPILDQYQLYKEKIAEINKFIKEETITKLNVKEIQDAMARNEKINNSIIQLKEYIDKSQRKSILKQFSDITDYHNSQ